MEKERKQNGDTWERQQRMDERREIKKMAHERTGGGNTNRKLTVTSKKHH